MKGRLAFHMTREGEDPDSINCAIQNLWKGMFCGLRLWKIKSRARFVLEGRGGQRRKREMLEGAWR